MMLRECAACHTHTLPYFSKYIMRLCCLCRYACVCVSVLNSIRRVGSYNLQLHSCSIITRAKCKLHLRLCSILTVTQCGKAASATVTASGLIANAIEGLVGHTAVISSGLTPTYISQENKRSIYVSQSKVSK